MAIWLADVMLTAQCNLHCPFCYGPDPLRKSDLNEAMLYRLIDLLKESGCTGVVFAGGEPLGHPRAVPIIEYTRKQGLKTAVQTNGTYLKTLQDALNCLDCLCLPLDGISKVTQLKMRTNRVHLDSFRKACNLAREFRERGGELKVGTVVTRFNIGELIEISDEVANVMPDRWKWYEVRKRGAAFKNFSELHVPSHEIQKAEDEVRARHPDISLHVSLCEMTNNAHLIIDSDGELLLTHNDRYISFGFLFDETGAINLMRWQLACGTINETRHVANITHSFPAETRKGSRWASSDFSDGGFGVIS